MGTSIPLTLATPLDPRDRRGRPLRDLRISLVDRCNFRCPYCMPEAQYPRDHAFLSSRERLSAGEIERFARIFASLGVTKLRLTGGEPLLRRDLPEIVARLSRIAGIDDLALTTNASLLAGQAGVLKQAGLHRLTVSLDALDAETFTRMSGGRGRIEDVLAGIDAASVAGFARIKLNAVVVRGVNEHAPIELLRRFRGTGHVVRFIEYMDVGTCNGWQAADVVPTRTLVERVAAVWPIVPLERARPGEVAERWAYADGQGELGFISSVSSPFCGDCNRARLSADGALYTCLFANHGTPLRDLARATGDDEVVRAQIAAIWSARADRYSELRATLDAAKRERIEMYSIGG